MKENWIKQAIKPTSKGVLRKKLGAKKGEDIPINKLEKAGHSKSPATRKQANLAMTLRKINKG